MEKHKKLLALLLIAGTLLASPLVCASDYLTNFYYNMGMKVLAYGFRPLAGEHFKQVLANDPDNYEVRLLYTLILIDVGQLNQALAQCKLLRESSQADGTVDVLEGQIYQKLGQLDKAEQLYQKALASDDQLATAHLGLAQIWALQNKEEAESAYRKVIELSPDRLDAYLELAQLLQKKGSLADAEGILKDGITVNRQWAPLHRQLAKIYQEAGRLEEAQVALERAEQLGQETQQAAN